MEETSIIIVGAGPSGLALGVSLSAMGIKTVILEKLLGVTEDPRGIAITGDAVRISYQLGVGEALTGRIGQNLNEVYFHHGSFQDEPFGSFDHGYDWMEQALPLMVLQFQPNFERELRKIIASSPHCELREQCEVFESKDEPQGVVVGYRDLDGKERHIRGQFLVGADGKTGVVRKKLLEPLGIKQEVGIFNFQETWVASNFQIIPPTPESHSDFPLWELGYNPDEVYDAFWPSGFHFCNDLARPSVSGPFGPTKSRFWRHEYSIQKGDSVENPLEDLMDNFRPWLSRPASHFKYHFPQHNLTKQDTKKTRGALQVPRVDFPKDCLKVLRCRAFHFAHKVANRWFHDRTLILGDAAHVFPPFGGQGIAAGLRDATSLAWRLALLLRLPPSCATSQLPPKQHALLLGWQNEQAQRVAAAARATRRNAVLTVERAPLRAFLARLLLRVIALVPGAHYLLSRARMGDDYGRGKPLEACEGGFFLGRRGGGVRAAQVWVRAYCRGGVELSDGVLLRKTGSLAVVVLLDGEKGIAAEAVDVEGVLGRVGLPVEVVGMGSVTFLLRVGRRRVVATKEEREKYTVCVPCNGEDLMRAGVEPMRGYDERSFERRVGAKAKYVLLRPDCFIHSVARTEDELLENLEEVKNSLSW